MEWMKYVHLNGFDWFIIILLIVVLGQIIGHRIKNGKWDGWFFEEVQGQPKEDEKNEPKGRVK
jgi:hypothetical protein